MKKREHIPSILDYILGKDGYVIEGDPEISTDILGRRSILGVTDRAKQRAALYDG